MPLHPDLESFLELVALGDHQPMYLQTPAAARASYDAATPLLDTPGEESVSTQEISFNSRDGVQLKARLYSTASNTTVALPALVFFHGGGYCIGGLDSHDALCRDLAHRAECKVLAVDYRLAPEFKFPTAVHDANDAWHWLQQHAADYGIDAARIAVGGDSAGGTLATVLCMALRDAGLPQPVLQLLLYPCTSSVQNSASHQRLATGYLLESQTLQWMFAHYLNHDFERNDWRFAPLLSENLSQLAPAHMVLAEFDPLLDEGRAYAERLQVAGVATMLRIYDGMVHDFARLGNIVADADTLRDDLSQQLRLSFGAA